MARPCNHRRRIRHAVFFASIIRRLRRLSCHELEALLAYFDAMPEGSALASKKARAA